jgi:hypothetical protein
VKFPPLKTSIMKTKEKESAKILIRDLRNKTQIIWENNGNPIRLEYLKKLIRDLEEEFKV